MDFLLQNLPRNIDKRIFHFNIKRIALKSISKPRSKFREAVNDFQHSLLHNFKPASFSCDHWRERHIRMQSENEKRARKSWMNHRHRSYIFSANFFERGWEKNDSGICFEFLESLHHQIPNIFSFTSHRFLTASILLRRLRHVHS